jgi:antitoxin MazE
VLTLCYRDAMNAPFRPLAIQSTLRKTGNSIGLTLPKAIVDQLGLETGAKVELRVENGELIARPARRKVREGWEEDAKRIGAAGLTEEEQDWLNMPNDFDNEWEW